MTSLIDVIFLLLLFFMLTSTFSKFAEVELAAAASTGPSVSDAPPLFLQLAPDSIRVNGDTLTMDRLEDGLQTNEPATVIVAMRDDVDAQRLTDLLVALHAFPKLTLTVLAES